jgi:predicted ATPase/DNA-binding SARP family transcriptional activator
VGVATADTAATEFRVLGPVEAARNGSLLPLGGPRQRALLALLLLQPGRPVSVDRLAEELWHGAPPNGAPTTIRSYVSRLRSALGSNATISSGPPGYALAADPEHIDAARFERLVLAGGEALARGAVRRAHDRFQEALSLWRGGPFGDVSDEGALRQEAERLEELRVHALEERVETELRLGESAELVDELETLVQVHPFRERFWRQLMLALYRAERQADALAAYRRARTILDDELGLEPSEELKRLEQAILRHEVEAVTPPEERHNLPAPVSSFVGREAELAEIARLLREVRLLTLRGVGGAGKTRLALAAAAEAVADCPDGVWFVDFSTIGEADLVPQHAARALDVREQPDVLIEEALTRRVRDADLLLVLDNCEHVRDACAELAHRLLTAGARLRILATSREALGVPGETDYPVPPLSVPSPDAAADELRASDAVRLFVTRARAARPGVADDDDAVSLAARICSDVDGLPLAIELAAARTKALSLTEIAGRISDRFRFLVSWRRLAAARHRTLQEAMDWSYELLSEQEQILLARLSVFVGAFSIAAVAVVCMEGDEERALELVERLVDASLVVAEERGTEMTYRLLETVRQYAAERLEERGEADDLQRRHGEYFLALAESARPVRRTLGPWVEAIAPAQDNLRAVLAWSRDYDEGHVLLRLAGEIWRLWWVRGELSEGRNWLEAALERDPGLDPAVRAEVLEGAAGLAWALGDLDHAGELAEEAQPLFAAVGDLRGNAAVVTILGHVALARRDFASGASYFETSRILGEEMENDAMVAVALHNLASVALGEGNLERAAAHYSEALARYEAQDDQYGVALSKLYLGFVAVETEDFGAAPGYLDHALRIFRDMNFLQYLSQCLEAIAAVARSRGRADEAACLLGAGSALRERTGESPTVASDRREHELAAARAELGGEAFAAAWTEGCALGESEMFDRAQRALAN